MIEEQVDEGDDPIDVEMHHWASARAPRQIGTTGLAACIGIAIMDDEGARAWVLHSPNMRHGEDGLRSMLHEVCEECSGRGNLRIVVTGAFDREPRASKDLKADKKFTIDLLQTMFPNAPPAGAHWEIVEDFNLQHDHGTWKDTLGAAIFS